jgi:micrococcal nuclease
MYHYDCKIVRVIDGDTVVAEVDLGFGVTISETFRLYGINAPEMRGETAEAGKASKEYLGKLLSADAVRVRTFKTLQPNQDKKGKFGRYLGSFSYANDPTTNKTINELMVAHGHAKHQTY